MIEVINYTNEKFEKEREQIISDAYSEVRALLPKLPEKIKLYFGEQNLVIPELGTGGFAYSLDIMTISLDPHFPDKEKQASSLRPAVFHESMHLYQNYTGQGPAYPPLETALYEGMATVFERQYANGSVPYGDYSEVKEVNFQEWINILKDIPADQYTDEIHAQWAFYNEKLNERWIIYRLGTWMVDNVLHNNQLDILDLKDKTAKEILEMFNPSLVN